MGNNYLRFHLQIPISHLKLCRMIEVHGDGVIFYRHTMIQLDHEVRGDEVIVYRHTM